MSFHRTWFFLLAVVVVLGAVAACQRSAPPNVDTTALDLEQARSALQKLAEGGKVGSEVGIVMRVAREVKKTDAAKGEALEKDGAELMRVISDPAKAKAKAKEILDKLPPGSGAPPPAK